MGDAATTTAEAAPSKARAEVAREASRIEESAEFSSKRHFETARIWGWFHWITGVPMVLLAALAGASPTTLAVVDGIVPMRLNDEEKGQIDEPDVVLDIATAEAPAKPHTPPMASSKPGRMLAFAPFQGVIRRMSD